MRCSRIVNQALVAHFTVETLLLPLTLFEVVVTHSVSVSVTPACGHKISTSCCHTLMSL